MKPGRPGPARTTVFAIYRRGTLLCAQLASLRARAAGMKRGSRTLRSAADFPQAARDTLTSSRRGSADSLSRRSSLACHSGRACSTSAPRHRARQRAWRVRSEGWGRVRDKVTHLSHLWHSERVRRAAARYKCISISQRHSVIRIAFGSPRREELSARDSRWIGRDGSTAETIDQKCSADG